MTETSNADQYCKPDLYDHYVEFQKKYGTAVLRTCKYWWERRSFRRGFHIYPRKKFWQWFDKLPAEHQAEHRHTWEIGYEEWIREDEREVDRRIEEI